MKPLHYPMLAVAVFTGSFIGLAATVTAWMFDGHASLGEPVHVGPFGIEWYEPWRVLAWWWYWGNDVTFTTTLREALKWTATTAAVLALASVNLVRHFGPLSAVEAEEQPERFGTARDLLRSHRISDRWRGIVLGREGRRIIWHVGDDHVLAVGASRVGEKGVSLVLPTIVDAPESLVVFDPKGELHAHTADERAKRGPVWLWDPTRAGTDRFNPLAELRGGRANIGDCRALANLMLADMHGHDPFWARKAADLCAGLIRACHVSGRATLQNVRALALRVGAGDRLADVDDRFAREMIDAHLAMEDRPRSGVDAQAQVALSFAGDRSVVTATSRSDFRVADLCTGARPATVYLTIAASQSESLRQVTRVVLQSLLLGMLHDHKRTSDGRLKRWRVLWVVDEFPELGHLPFIEHGMALAAGYGLKLLLVCQNVEQIWSAYGRDQSITGNCGTIVATSFSKGTMELLTSEAGTMIATMRAKHKKVGWGTIPSETVSQSRHPVLNAREAHRMERDHVYVVHHGTKPVWLEKARYYEIEEYRRRIRG